MNHLAAVKDDPRVKGWGQSFVRYALSVSKIGKVPQGIVKTVNSYSDLIALESLTVLAATCDSLNEFKEGLK
ncbi:MAG: hypothetical protein LBT89_08015 [Planctomycetaceae bacterium]|jgi:hypothetical protein|nr:hypothetical protein [Planctomycetaceae bacterium]